MKKHTAKSRARQFRRQWRYKRRERRRAEQRATRSLPHPSRRLDKLERFVTQADRLACPGDRLRTICVGGVLAEQHGLPNNGELYPVHSVLVRDEDTPLEDESEPLS